MEEAREAPSPADVTEGTDERRESPPQGLPEHLHAMRPKQVPSVHTPPPGGGGVCPLIGSDPTAGVEPSSGSTPMETPGSPVPAWQVSSLS
jgi:hypothetical protein